VVSQILYRDGTSLVCKWSILAGTGHPSRPFENWTFMFNFQMVHYPRPFYMKIHKKPFFFCLKWASLTGKNLFWFSNCENKMAAITIQKTS
jgi:hypothetical protein